MKLFILETYIGDNWVPISFFTGTYREVITGLGDHYTAASRVRRVRSREEYHVLSNCLRHETTPLTDASDFDRTAILDSSVVLSVEWTE